ncbi:lipid IV(A) 3-deoxy-D-manno-octulosonic acid transferase [Endozoicomonas sp. SM1973]|uniref:3-deoxy-D-manno-octulosonic acid transferase n=1 Tax=Spartinivicinus marinus TaxID=2994442 RepID=A0A853IBH2_9GAMM|nr:lipid IV(A) 3-deoxy-D-manno-octulosonic acid transferase [Spartinivicinus marinus]MCX4026092.1 lipid IV(A) 3-deoxy-D-manno-octulosonic acid transferase [Spartinivicinus marinus]NYZ66575.1 lipid IV(A) 3-deoxy-D-manno-octulosonic acid transferase [Spartinivicinus marinus]
MNRFWYTLLFYFLLPLILLKLCYRGIKAPAYRKRWRERFGFVEKPQFSQQPIWVHAVSVGETIAAIPLIKQIQQQYPEHPLVVTTMTPTGSERVTALLGDQVFHVYAPYDLPGSVNRFLEKTNPCLAVIMETELWPNLVHGCANKNIPVVVANARLSERSAKGYGRFKKLVQPMLTEITQLAAQDQATADRFLSLGLSQDQLKVTGSIKFDIDADPAEQQKGDVLRQSWLVSGSRPVWVAASTHSGEDEVILKAHQQLLSKLPSALLVLVPRHPERFDEVARLIEQQQLSYIRRSTDQQVSSDTQVILGDTMGELKALYVAADVAFIGGSLLEGGGGHNMLEAAVWAKPLLSGPNVINFQEITDKLLSAGGMRLVSSANEIAEQLIKLLTDKNESKTVGTNALQVVKENRGALQSLLDLVSQSIKQ